MSDVSEGTSPVSAQQTGPRALHRIAIWTPQGTAMQAEEGDTFNAFDAAVAAESTLDLAPIGNCKIALLINKLGRIVWGCFPRFDGDPIFCSLLTKEGDKGFFDVGIAHFSHAKQAYRKNTAILETTLCYSMATNSNTTNQVKITDFVPRFNNYDRVFRPIQLVRKIEIAKGTPQIMIRIRPCSDYGSRRPVYTYGSNHIRFQCKDNFRMTTDAPIGYILDEVPFLLEKPFHILFGPDESLHEPLSEVVRRFTDRTEAYWQKWSRSLSIMPEYQDATIRAAITLKLTSYEETGAIVAALTTSIPEHADSGRNWDYRFCWLRDAYFVVQALNKLGTTETMENYLNFICNLVVSSNDGYLQPLFGISREKVIEEAMISPEHLDGYRGMGPVRIGNAAYTQVQNDSYGSVILASTQMFFDHRLQHPGDKQLYERLEKLGDQAIERWNQSDAGLWELRTFAHIHTYSSVMCWAACDRLSKVACRLHLPDRAAHWERHAEKIHKEIIERAFNREINSFTDVFDGDEVDACLLLLPQFGFVEYDDPRFLGTLKRVEDVLKAGHYLYRYRKADDFGEPVTSFNVCTFWYIEALIGVGRINEAKSLFERMLRSRNHVGILSEDMSILSEEERQQGKRPELWGNTPQTYSMVRVVFKDCSYHPTNASL